MKQSIILIFITITSILLINIKDKELNSLKNQRNIYLENINLLTHNIKEIYNAKLKLENKIRELETAASKDSFDWYKDISNTYVIKQLQTN